MSPVSTEFVEKKKRRDFYRQEKSLVALIHDPTFYPREEIGYSLPKRVETNHLPPSSPSNIPIRAIFPLITAVPHLLGTLMSRLASAKGIFDRGREMVNKVASFEGAIEIIEAKKKDFESVNKTGGLRRLVRGDEEQ